jgi:hypothetical protein
MRQASRLDVPARKERHQDEDCVLSGDATKSYGCSVSLNSGYGWGFLILDKRDSGRDVKP